MRPDRLLAFALVLSLLAGCRSVDDWSGLKRGKDATPVERTDDGQIVAGYLATLDRLGRGGAAEQAEIVEATRNAYLAEPSTGKRLARSVRSLSSSSRQSSKPYSEIHRPNACFGGTGARPTSRM